MMAIYDTSTNELLEQYLMKINTDPTGQSLAIELKKKNPNGDDTKQSNFEVTKKNIEGNFRRIVRSIQAISETQQLLPQGGVYVKLVAVLNDACDRDYGENLEGFSAFLQDSGQPSAIKFPKNVDSESIKLGTIATGYHTIDVKMRVKAEDIADAFASDTDEEDVDVEVREQKYKVDEAAAAAATAAAAITTAVADNEATKDDHAYTSNSDDDFEPPMPKPTSKKKKKKKTTTSTTTKTTTNNKRSRSSSGVVTRSGVAKKKLKSKQKHKKSKSSKAAAQSFVAHVKRCK